MAMSKRKPTGPGTTKQEAKLHRVDGVQVYARMDQRGWAANLDAIDQNEEKIRAIADRLYRRGFGVMRQRRPRAGKVFYLLKATWPGPGAPPRDPFEDERQLNYETGEDHEIQTAS
jgi:hypothetical protein